MDSLLDIDLNEIASKAIKERITSLEKEVKDYALLNHEQRKEISTLKREVEKSTIALSLLNYLQGEFLKIKQSEEDKQGYYKSKQENQYHFISKALTSIFNIIPERNGWYCYRNDGNLETHLAINFYNNKTHVINLLKALMPDYQRQVSFIESFKMPYDYNKKEVLNYVSNPQYNTNGCIFGISQYWIERGAGKDCMPHDLIMKNPFILADDVFNTLLQSIKKRVSNYYYLYALPLHNNNISDSQLEALGECLITENKGVFGYDDASEFMSKNIKKFNSKTLEYLYTLITTGNQFQVLHWGNFPNEYQMRFLLSQPFDVALKLITDYHCTWTVDQKQSFLKEYTNKMKS